MADVIDNTKPFTIVLTPVIEPAKGKIVNLNYPASVEQGAEIIVNAAVKNVGGSSGNFYLYLYRGTHEEYEYEIGNVGVGATSQTVPLRTNAPTSGTSVSYTVKCIRIA